MGTLDGRMAPRGPKKTTELPAGGTLSAEQFGVRFHSEARVLWTLAAGVLGGPSEAEDVLQEACMAALGKLDQFQPGTNFLAWMGRFVRNVALNERRKRTRRQTPATDPALLDDQPSSAPGPARASEPVASEPVIDARGVLAVDRGHFDDRLLGALRELGEVPRACLLLRVVSDLGYADIAALLAVPEGTAMSHVHRARLFLRERLGGAQALDAATLSAESRP